MDYHRGVYMVIYKGTSFHDNIAFDMCAVLFKTLVVGLDEV